MKPGSIILNWTQKGSHGMASATICQEAQIQRVLVGTKVMLAVLWYCEGVILADVPPGGETL
jgi:hypothetical protein